MPKPKLQFSICSPAEYGEVIALVNNAYRGQDGASGWTHEIGLVDGQRISCERLHEELGGDGEPAILLLREDSRLLACVHIGSTRGRSGEPACYIGMLAVQPQEQGRGLGRHMLEHAEAQGRARGARTARMTVVSVRAPLIAWYERCGYRRTGETEPFPYDDPRFGIPLQPGLEFVVLERALNP